MDIWTWVYQLQVGKVWSSNLQKNNSKLESHTIYHHHIWIHRGQIFLCFQLNTDKDSHSSVAGAHQTAMVQWSNGADVRFGNPFHIWALAEDKVMEKYESSTSSLFSYKGKEIEAQFQLGQSDVNIHHVQTMFVHLEGARCLTEFSVINPLYRHPWHSPWRSQFLGRWMWCDRNRPMCFGKTSIPQRKRFDITRGQTRGRNPGRIDTGCRTVQQDWSDWSKWFLPWSAIGWSVSKFLKFGIEFVKPTEIWDPIPSFPHFLLTYKIFIGKAISTRRKSLAEALFLGIFSADLLWCSHTLPRFSKWGKMI